MTIKHFTSTVFVVFKNRIFLHWHTKVKEWLPPGGHIELNENPIETAIRETIEELGIEIQIVNRKANLFKFDDVDSIPSPETILLEEVVDQTKGKHIHIKGNDIFVYWDHNAEPSENGNKWRKATNPLKVEAE